MSAAGVGVSAAGVGDAATGVGVSATGVGVLCGMTGVGDGGVNPRGVRVAVAVRVDRGELRAASARLAKSRAVETARQAAKVRGYRMSLSPVRRRVRFTFTRVDAE